MPSERLDSGRELDRIDRLRQVHLEPALQGLRAILRSRVRRQRGRGNIADRSILRLPHRLFPRIVPSGTVLGPMRSDIAQQAGLENVQVIASCSHDTGAAIAGLPAAGQDWAFLSSGTWSLMGVETPEPVINETSRQLNFTNEIGYGHSVRLLKNIAVNRADPRDTAMLAAADAVRLVALHMSGYSIRRVNSSVS